MIKRNEYSQSQLGDLKLGILIELPAHKVIKHIFAQIVAWESQPVRSVMQ